MPQPGQEAILLPLGFDPVRNISYRDVDFGGAGADTKLIHAEATTNLFDYGSQTARKTVRGLNIEYVFSREGGDTYETVPSFDIYYSSDQDGSYNTALARFTGLNITSNMAFKCTFGVRGKYIRHSYFYKGPSGLTIYRECETVRLDGSSNSGEIEGLAQGTVNNV